jgi:hypothetical protein
VVPEGRLPNAWCRAYAKFSAEFSEAGLVALELMRINRLNGSKLTMNITAPSGTVFCHIFVFNMNTLETNEFLSEVTLLSRVFSLLQPAYAVC